MTELRTTAGLAESHVWGGSCKTKYEWYRRRLASNEPNLTCEGEESRLRLRDGRMSRRNGPQWTQHIPGFLLLSRAMHHRIAYSWHSTDVARFSWGRFDFLA